MGNTTRRDVELRINANDLSEKTLQQLLETFDKLRASQEALAKSGDLSQRSVRELKQDLADLQAVAVELKSRAALVDQFLAIEKRASDAALRVEAAKVALQKFNAAQAEGAELTKKEQVEFARLTREVQKAEKSLDTNTAKLKEFGAALSQVGAGDASQTREALLRFSADLGTSLASAEKAIRGYDEALRANEKKERDAAEAKREAAKAAQALKGAQEALASNVAFNAQGREALKAASNVEVLTRDYDKLAASSRKAGDGIRQILDPSREALSSLTGLEAEIKRLHTQLDSLQASPKLGEELKQIRTEYNALAADAGKAAASLVDDIGSYRKTEEAVAALRARLEGAQQSVREFASQMAVTSEPSEKLSKDLANAQGRLRSLVGEFDREAQALATLKLRLNEAGVDVNHLADAEQRLQGVAAGVVESQRKIGDVTARVNDLAKATAAIKAAQDELADGVAFNQLGRDALKAATNVEALSRDYDALAVSSRKAGDGIRGIIDPSRQALTSLDGLETQTRQLNEQLQQAASSGKLREEVRRLRSEYSALANDSGKAAAALGDQIGAYRQGEQAVATLRARVEDALQSVRKFAGQMAVAASPSEALTKSLATAKAQLATLVGEFERQSGSLAKLRAELREAGVATDSLNEAEKRLENVARGVVAAQRALGTAAVQVGNDSDRGARGLSVFADSGRKALSAAQRLRGELLSLASSYLGLFAAVNVAHEAIDAAVSREGILRRLELVEGSAAKAEQRFKQLRKSADELGISFVQSANGFADIAISAKEAGVSSERLDHFYKNLGKSVQGLSLNGEKAQRVFSAISQIFGKQQIQSEELKQQLAEHLAGVVAISQKGLGRTADEFKKDLEEGRLGVDALLVIMDEYGKRMDQLEQKQNSASKALALFDNALNDLKLAIADSGFLETFTDLLKEATEAIKSGRMNEAIKGLGTLLRLAADAARFLLENVDLTVAVFASFIAMNVGKLLFGIGQGFWSLVTAVRASTIALGLLRGAVMIVTAHPLVALITLLYALAVSTEKGRAVLRALWQVVVEFGGTLADLLTLDFKGFARRIEGSMERVAAAFRGAKKDADDLANVERGGSSRSSGGATGSWDAGGATGSWEDDAIAIENKRRAEAELTRRTVEGIEKHMAEMRKAAAKETAKALGDVEAEVRAEYQETQDKINELVKRGTATNNEATIAAAKKVQETFDKTIATIVKARKAMAAKTLTKPERGELNERLEEARQRAEVVKEGLRLEQSELELSYKEGLVSLRDYHAKRLDETKRGLNAEIDAAKEQIEILEKVQAKDPTAAKKIVKLKGEIASKEKEIEIAERRTRLETELGEKALRRQVSALQAELDELTGSERQAGLRAVQEFYLQQLDVVNQLKGAEKERALILLEQTVRIKSQLVDIAIMRREADHLMALREAAIDSSAGSGDLSHMQELAARSASNKIRLTQLEQEAEEYRKVGETGTAAYRDIQVQIVKLQGETDLLGKEVAATLKDAASSLVTTLIETRSPQKAMSAFGKSLGSALSKAFVDEAATAILKFFKDIGGFDLLKGLFKGIGGLFGSTSTPTAGKSHGGAVIGYGGAVPVRVSPFAFLGAQVYHGGGLPGLRHDEVATILKKREEVLAVDDPRNVLNGGKSAHVSARGGPLFVQLHPDAMHMSLRDWLERELARAGATQ